MTIAIDGNVLRVLTRYYGITEDIRLPKVKNMVEEKLNDFYSCKQPKPHESEQYLSDSEPDV